jgi:hypothetical protein
MKNKAAQQLGRLGGKVTSEAKAAAVRENGKKGGRPPGLCVGNKFFPRTVVSLYKSEGEWCVETYKGDIIPSKSFPTAQAARDFAASKNWGVKRQADCDS